MLHREGFLIFLNQLISFIELFFWNDSVQMQKWSHFILSKQFSDKNNKIFSRGVVLLKNSTQRKFNFLNIGHFNWTEITKQHKFLKIENRLNIWQK